MKYKHYGEIMKRKQHADVDGGECVICGKPLIYDSRYGWYCRDCDRGNQPLS